MPYRRLPKTDAARLKALKTLLDNDSVYTVRDHFIDWKTINEARPIYDRLSAAVEQVKQCLVRQTSQSATLDKPRHNAQMYLSHFLQVLLMAIERGEIRRQQLTLYGMAADAKVLPKLTTDEDLITWGQKVIDGEKARLRAGGRPIYNPTIGMVSTHYDIFKNLYDRYRFLTQQTQRAQEEILLLRPQTDAVLLSLWNQIEARYANEPWGKRMKHCGEFGVVYYYRRGEKK